MLKSLFTKKRKKAELEKEIQSLLTLIQDLRPSDGDNTTNLDVVINDVLEHLQTMNPSSDEYHDTVRNLEMLYKAKEHDVSKMDEYSKLVETLEKLYKARETMKKQSQFPWKEVAVGTFGLIQIIWVLKHEKIDIITSKAFGMVMKGRV